MRYITIILILSFVLALLCCVAKNEKKYHNEVHDCYIQEPRTKECEYIVWKYETDKKSVKKESGFTKGLLVGTIMSGGFRR